MAKKSKKKKPAKQRNLNKLLEARGEINLATRTGQDKAKPKYTRKEKHKAKY